MRMGIEPGAGFELFLWLTRELYFPCRSTHTPQSVDRHVFRDRHRYRFVLVAAAWSHLGTPGCSSKQGTVRFLRSRFESKVREFKIFFFLPQGLLLPQLSDFKEIGMYCVAFAILRWSLENIIFKFLGRAMISHRPALLRSSFFCLSVALFCCIFFSNDLLHAQASKCHTSRCC
jgi:hypothetical protein